MRLDKDIWESGCFEYNAVAIFDHDLRHFTPAARTFVSLWLELLQDDRAPATRVLSSVSLPDLFAVLRRAIDLYKHHDNLSYRFHAALRQIVNRIDRLAFQYPGRMEAQRLRAHALDYFELRDAPDRKKAENPLRQKYNLPVSEDVEKHLLHRIQQLATAVHGLLRDGSEYREALVDDIRECITGSTPSLWTFCNRAGPAVEEVLSFSLDRGSSRESLAELPIKYLRGDRHAMADPSLDARLRLILGALRGGARDHYNVYLPLEGPSLAIPGEIFPSGVSLLSNPAWNLSLAQFGTDAQKLGPSTCGFKVVIAEYLQGFRDDESPPRDVFAARDIAVRATRQCLDAVFLYSRRNARTGPFGGVVVFDNNANAIHRTVLEHHREHGFQANIVLPFVRPVPPDWADSLHWYRIGTATPKHEAGIVNLWTAAEILAERSPRLEGSKLDTVLRSVGVMSSLFLFYDEQLYFALAARAYADRYPGMNQPIPAQGADDRAVLLWWLDLCISRPFRDLEEQVFAHFPHLAFEAARVRRWSYHGDEIYKAHKTAIEDNLRWIYGCRNDIVHEGMQRVAGAAIARDLLTEYLGLTLRRSLSMRARGSGANPSECFYLAAEIEISVIELLSKHRLGDALLHLS